MIRGKFDRPTNKMTEDIDQRLIQSNQLIRSNQLNQSNPLNPMNPINHQLSSFTSHYHQRRLRSPVMLSSSKLPSIIFTLQLSIISSSMRFVSLSLMLLFVTISLNVAFCLPQTNQNFKNSIDTLSIDYHQLQQLQNHHHQQQRLKRDLFILNKDDNDDSTRGYDPHESYKAPTRKIRESQSLKNHVQQSTNNIYEYCPSKECYRKVVNFEHFLRLYTPKNFQMTQFDCALRDIFFNCIKDESRRQQNRKCLKKRYDHFKKRIAKLLLDTRLCIGS